MAKKRIPVYFPDQTIMANAFVENVENTAVITIQGNAKIVQFIEEELVGLSVMYMDQARAEEILNTETSEEGEETDAPQD